MADEDLGGAAPLPPPVKSRQTAVVAVAAMVVLGVVSVTVGDLAIISTVGGFLTTILGITSQRHTSADLFASSPSTPGRPPS